MRKALLAASAVAALLGFAVTAYAAVHVIPPSDYNRGCHPNGKALQGDRADDTIRGTARREFCCAEAAALTRSLGVPLVTASSGGDGRDLIKGGQGRHRIGGGAGSDALRGNTATTSPAPGRKGRAQGQPRRRPGQRRQR